jgi:peptide/nickel transport system substrate-binding protein
MILSACGGGSGNNTTSGTRATTLRVLPAPGQPNPDLFNPYFNTNQGGDFGAQGLLYEVLYFTNILNGQTTPWLATGSSYNSDLTQLTFHLRPGVKWNDGQPLTSADVAFTFQLMQQYPDLDKNGVMPLVKSWTTPDDSTITFTLTRPNSTALYHLGGQVFIIPKHIWSSVSGDPAKFANDQNPVGTGPYLLSHYDQNLITYKVNPNYWGTKPAVQTIQVPSVKDNTTAITDMVKGQLDWMGTGWNPQYDPLFGNKDPQHNHTWFTPSNTVMLYLNLKKAPFNNLLVRKAISAAINRDALPQGLALYAKVASPTGVVVPTLKDWVSSQYQSATFQYSTDQAKSYLQQAGYTFNKSDNLFHDASGKTLSMSLIVPNGWSDWDQDLQNIGSDLVAAGIDATVNLESGYTPYYTALSNDTFDAAISWTDSGPTPYYSYRDMLLSSNATVPVSGTNFERWDATTSNGFSAQTDALLKQYESTNDVNAQKQALAGIEDIMVNQLPAIPLTVNVYWDEYTTTNWTGWPDASNPYDSGPPYNMPDAENVILHLTPAS